MNRVVIKKSIPVECHALGPDLDKYIEEKLTEQVGKCSQEYGYILSVGKFKIVDTEISRATTETIMVVTFEAETAKPEVGKTLTAVVSMCVSGHGIYAYNNGKIKVLIPERSLKTFKFVSGAYASENTTYKTGDEIVITITAIKYDKNNFQCIGHMTV